MVKSQRTTSTILQIIPFLHNSDVEKNTVELSKTIIDNNMKSIVVSGGGMLAGKIIEHGAKHITLDLTTKNPFKLYSNIRKISNIINEYGVNIIHSRSQKTSFISHQVAKKKSLPLITSFYPIYDNKGLGKYINNITTKGDIITVPSDFIKDIIHASFPEISHKIAVIYNNINVEHFNSNSVPIQRIDNARTNLGISKVKEDKKIILFPCENIDSKLCELVVKALSTLDSRKYHAVILGTGNNSRRSVNDLHKLIKSYDLTSNVNYSERLFDHLAIYAAVDIVISPFDKEGEFDRISLEAGSMEKIAVAQNLGNSAEMIIDQDTGFLFTQNDHEDLTSILDHVINLPKNKMAEIGRRARNFVKEKYDLTNTQNAIINLYKDLLSSSTNTGE